MEAPDPDPARPARAPRSARPAPPPGRKGLWLLGGVLLLAGLGFGVAAWMQHSKDQRARQGEAEYASAPLLTVEALAGARRAGAADFDAQHKGRALAVEGVVARVESVEGAFGSGTQRVVRLGGPDGLEIACWFNAAEAGQAATWAPGARVAVVGRWAGEGNSAMELVLRSCRAR